MLNARFPAFVFSAGARAGARARRLTGGAGLGALLILLHTQAVLHFLDTGEALDQRFSPTFVFTTADGSGQLHFAFLHRDFDVGSIETIVVGEAITDFLTNALVGATVSARSTAAILARLLALR